ncbi:MAG TPA: alpha/beta hydrolase [Ilumatobacteraceae bacterium]|nr:alpha/beta hydrolase [Ilumatobacteraceae bacterium]
MSDATLTHNRVRLTLHELRGGDGRPLLLLHGLGEQTPPALPEWAEPWPGPVYGLDFTGHGASTVPVGGGYSAEILLADADAALAHLGPSTVVGRGLGAYIALLLAGARPALARGVVLCDGPGLWGGASGPTSSDFVVLNPEPGVAPDPYALHELSKDLRPRDYATLFVRLALEHSGLDEPVAVAAVVRPPWLEAVVDELGVTVCTVPEALAAFATQN